MIRENFTLDGKKNVLKGNIIKAIDNIKEKNNMNYNICIVGLGYVGIQLACEFVKKVSVYGYDTNIKKVENYENGCDITQSVDTELLSEITFITDENIFNKFELLIFYINIYIIDFFCSDISDKISKKYYDRLKRDD